MGGDGLGVLDATAVEQLGRDARGPKRVAVGRHTDLRPAHPSLDHAEDVDAAHAVSAEGSIPRACVV